MNTAAETLVWNTNRSGEVMVGRYQEPPGKQEHMLCD